MSIFYWKVQECLNIFVCLKVIILCKSKNAGFDLKVKTGRIVQNSIVHSCTVLLMFIIIY